MCGFSAKCTDMSIHTYYTVHHYTFDNVCKTRWHAWASKVGDASPPVEKSAGNFPPPQKKQYLFSWHVLKFCIFSISKIKWPKSEEKLNFGVMLDLVPINPSPCPPPILKQNFVATPLMICLVRGCFCHFVSEGRKAKTRKLLNFNKHFFLTLSSQSYIF